MAPPEWAYHVEHFHPAPDDELICSICQGVFCDPVQSPCNHVFCRNCIVKWLESNRNCPICRKRTTRATIQDVVPLINNMIMKLTLLCHNSSRGCEEKFQLESCEAHVRECPFELVHCKNRPCKMQLMQRDLADHEQSCPHSFVRCKACKLKMLTKAPQGEHNCIKELRKKLKEKNEKINKSKQKLKKLKTKIKRMRDDGLYSTASSSNDGVSLADLLFDRINRSSFFDSSSSIPSDDSNSDDDIGSDSSDNEEDSDEPQQLRGTPMILQEFLRRVNTRMLTENIMQPRVSTSAASAEDYVTVAEPLHDPLLEALAEAAAAAPELEAEPPVRRPSKRRFTNRILDSSEEEDGVESDPLPSRKRVWQLRGEEEGAIGGATSRPGTSNAGRSSSAGSTTSIHNSLLDRNRQRLIKSRLRSRSIEQAPAPMAEGSAESTIPAANPTFERTLSLLERYNLESDPEWLPGTGMSDGLNNSDTDNLDVPGRIISSEESSISELSDSSYEDASEGRIGDLLKNLCDTVSGSEE